MRELSRSRRLASGPVSEAVRARSLTSTHTRFVGGPRTICQQRTGSLVPGSCPCPSGIRREMNCGKVSAAGHRCGCLSVCLSGYSLLWFPHSGQWSDGIFDCFSDGPSCMLGTLGLCLSPIYAFLKVKICRACRHREERECLNSILFTDLPLLNRRMRVCRRGRWHR